MREKIGENVSVGMFYSTRKRVAMPRVLIWQNKEYHFDKIGYHHTIKKGEVLHHIFELADRNQTMWFRLNLNTSNMQWMLEAVSDGLAN